MKLHQIKLLTDENISPKVIIYLRKIGVDILDVKEQEWFGKEDEILLNISYQENRFVLTHDSDFGTLAINQDQPCYGILYLRLKNLKSKNVCQVCENLFQSDMDISPHSIWVIKDAQIRIRHLINT